VPKNQAADSKPTEISHSAVHDSEKFGPIFGYGKNIFSFRSRAALTFADYR